MQLSIPSPGHRSLAASAERRESSRRLRPVRAESGRGEPGRIRAQTPRGEVYKGPDLRGRAPAFGMQQMDRHLAVLPIAQRFAQRSASDFVGNLIGQDAGAA